MVTPTLIIGMGGTGQWVLTYLKKNLIDAYGKMPVGVKLLALDLDCFDTRMVGDVSLEPWERICIGSDLSGFLKQIASDEQNQMFSHVRNWFKPDDYLFLLPSDNHDVGHTEIRKGQSRQIARLAIFQDLQRPESSKILARLRSLIEQIQREANFYNLPVFLVGSLAGVTGTGMFMDIAYLTRQIAREWCHSQVTISGIFILPDAFRGALPAGYPNWHSRTARTFAAMRETRRFTVSFDWEVGYPIHYVAPTTGFAGDSVLAGSINGQLFDRLYYIDGRRRNFPLDIFPIEKGIAPAISDMLGAFLQESPYSAFEENLRNLQAVVAVRGGDPMVPYCGSFGTFSVVLPIHHIIQGYAHRLGMEVLHQFLQPTAIDSRTSLPTDLVGDQNAEAAEGCARLDAARAFLTSQAISDPIHPASTVVNTSLTGDLVNLVERFSPADMSVVGRLVERSVQDWESIFTPTGQSEDILKARLQVEAVLKMRLEPPTDRPSSLARVRSARVESQTALERPVNRVLGIENTVRMLKDLYLGVEQKETDQRSGGKYLEVLDTYAAVHLDRFQRMLENEMYEVLNGRPGADPVLAKAGKLGHLLGFLEGVYSYLGRGYQIMRRVIEHRRCQANGRAQARADVQHALFYMKSLANDAHYSSTKARKSQDAYLEAEQRLIDIHKVEIVEQVVADTIKQMQELVASAKASADSWAQTLGIGQGSLYAALLAGKRQVDENRDTDANVESRLVLGARKPGKEEDAEYKRFREYEERRYRHYVYEGQANQVATLLGDLNWQVSTEVKTGKPILRLGLKFGKDASQSLEASEQSIGKNLDLFLSRTQQLFDSVRSQESVLDYLMYVHQSPEALADLIYEHSGILLNHDAIGPIPAIYLEARFGPESRQADYLRGMLRRLASRSNITGMECFARLVNSENRFACTLVHTMDLIEMDRTAAYDNAMHEYIGYTSEQDTKGSQRTVLHCFPAEVNAVQFEERLSLVNQASRMLHDDIVLQLEKEDNLRLFLFCWGYRLINTHAFDDVGVTKNVYRLQWGTADELDSGEVWLTKPQKDTAPDFLEALRTFNYVGRDIGHGDTYLKRIEWDRVKATLEERYREDTATRRAEGTLGASAPALRNQLDIQKVPDDEALWLLIARLDRLSEMDKKLTEIAAALDKQLQDPAHRDDEDLHKQYDLASVFVLILIDEQEKLRQSIKDHRSWSSPD